MTISGSEIGAHDVSNMAGTSESEFEDAQMVPGSVASAFGAVTSERADSAAALCGETELVGAEDSGAASCGEVTFERAEGAAALFCETETVGAHGSWAWDFWVWRGHL